MSIASEFKEFALKGNVVDLAVGVIIGAAFGKIIGSLVDDLIMPLVGKLLNNINFVDMFVPLKDIPAGTVMTLEAVRKAGIPVFAYGNFITILLNFVMLAIVIFLMVKQINKLKKEAPPAAPTAIAEDVMLLREIRDSLKKQA